ncbi:MAG: ABC transporter ATP-binding protein [Oligoflexia bacterium]|nr:ABC transporter ATP-binding protein [Oligoflexia bacterium]
MESRAEVTGTELSIRNVTKQFNIKGKSTPVIKDISLEVRAGEFVCIVGPSGCGKSTLLNLVAGLEHPEEGAIWEAKEQIQGPSRDRLMMFQDAALFPWLDVLGNVMFSLKLAPQIPKEKRIELAVRYLRMVGLGRFRRSFVHELSGGMKQRVALARALAADPSILLMDEPFAALDAMTREQLYFDLQHIWMSQKKTVLLVTHNIREAVCLGDRVVLMTGSPGIIKDQFEIDMPRPRDINSVSLAQTATNITHALKGAPAVFQGI